MRNPILAVVTLWILIAQPAESAIPITMDMAQTANRTTYTPQENYIHPSGSPFVAQDGSIWWPLSESNRGLGFNGALKYDAKTWIAYTSEDGLFDGAVRAITQAPNGTLYFAGSHQNKATIAQFDGQNWKIYADAIKGKTTGVKAVVDQKGNLWVTTGHTNLRAAETDSSKGGHGIYRFDGNTWTHFTVAEGLAHNRVYDIAEGRNGIIWVGTFKGLSKYEPRSNTWTTYTTKDGLSDNKVYSVLPSREGLIWCAHGRDAGISVFNRREWQTITRADGLPAHAVRSAIQTQDGTLYFGTHPHDGATGLIRHHRGNWLRLLAKDGLPRDQVMSLVEDQNRGLWMYAPNRLDRFTLDFSTLKNATATLRDEGELLKNAGLHLVDRNGEVRAGTTTDVNGRYRVPMFDEEYNVVPLQTRKLNPELVENLTGAWMGTLTLPGIKLRLVFHLKPDSTGQLAATLDSPDQGVTDIKTDEISIRRKKMRIGIHRIRGTYQGEINSTENPTQITGTWKQMGRELSLVLQKTDQAPTLNRPQEPKKPYPYHSVDITFENTEANIKIAGTLTKPKGDGPFPAVLLISGSGPNDRNETVIGHKPFLVLADHLTRKGIAVLRTDDRGVGKSTGQYNKATTEDLATDALAAVKYLKTRNDIRPDQIGLAGHSEGGLIAPLAAIQTDDIAFIVMMGGPGLPGDDIIKMQQKLIIESIGASQGLVDFNQTFISGACEILKTEPNDAIAAKKIRTLYTKTYDTLDDTLKKELKDLGSMDTEATLNALLPVFLSSWYRYFLVHDPADILKKVTCPTLAIIGEKDIQVPSKENIEAIEQAFKSSGHTNYLVKELPSLNHLFQTAATGALSEYGQIEETFAPLALNTISDWIELQVKR